MLTLTVFNHICCEDFSLEFDILSSDLRKSPPLNMAALFSFLMPLVCHFFYMRRPTCTLNFASRHNGHRQIYPPQSSYAGSISTKRKLTMNFSNSYIEVWHEWFSLQLGWWYSCTCKLDLTGLDSISRHSQVVGLRSRDSTPVEIASCFENVLTDWTRFESWIAICIHHSHSRLLSHWILRHYEETIWWNLEKWTRAKPRSK